MSFSAESYENHIVPSLFAPCASRLIQRANPQLGERVLDIASGTGIVARKVAPLVGSQGMVTGLDVRAEVIDLAHTISERDHLAIEWCVNRAERLPFPDEAFDLVFCQFGLMFFTDQHTALMEMQRVLRRKGRVALSVWEGLERHPFYQTLHEVSYQHLGISIVEDIFSLGDAEEVRKLLLEAGFQHVVIEPMSITARFPQPEEFLAWEINVDPAQSPRLRNLEPEAQQLIIAAVRQDMQGTLEKVLQDNQVVLEYHAHVVIARD